jgi:2-polyprenyl-3-methyl-5-hydroxy-6-metoxy-1,4-benzoquinol methylase
MIGRGRVNFRNMIMLDLRVCHMFLSRLRIRHRQSELMDQPELDPVQHREALRSLVRINRISFSAGILWPSIRRLARQLAPHPLRILDVACGAGDVTIGLARRAVRAKLPVSIRGCDLSPVAIDFAMQQARDAEANVAFQQLDVLKGELPTGFDVITCSLFLHHLDEADALQLLGKMGEAAGRMVLVNDLARSRIGYMLAWAGTRLLSRSAVVRFDGPVSVEGAFTPAEALALAERAGMHGASVRRRWPCRFLLRWCRLVDTLPALSEFPAAGLEANPT